MEIPGRLYFVLFIITQLYFELILSKCEIEIKDLTSQGATEPLFLSKSSNPEKFFLKIPRNGLLTYEDGDSFYSLCPKIKKSPPVLAISQCEIDQFNPPPVLTCRNSHTPIARPKASSEKCGPKLEGQLFEIGYKLQNSDDFSVLTTVCRNQISESTFYSQHVLYEGNVGKYMKQKYQNKNWDSSYYEQDTVNAIEDNFNNDKQKAFFRTIHLNTDDRLSRGHLNPNGDQPLHLWKKATYFYLNHVPQWQGFNEKAWENVEYNVKIKSDQGDLIIFTGGHGQFTINNNNLFMTNIAGSDNGNIKKQRIQVPKFIWKLFYNVKNQHCLAFVTMNFNYGSDAINERDPEMCSDRDQECTKKDYGRLSNNINNPESGFLSCCSYDELRKMIQYDLIYEGTPLQCLTLDEVENAKLFKLVAISAVVFSTFTILFIKTTGKK